MLIGKPFNPIRARHVPIARTPERQRINQGFAQNNFFARHQCDFIKHTPTARFIRRQIQMLRCPRPQIIANLSAVELTDRAGLQIIQRKHRHHQRAVEVLMPALPVHPQLLQSRANLRPVFSLPVRQPKPKRAIREPELERVNQFRVI